MPLICGGLSAAAGEQQARWPSVAPSVSRWRVAFVGLPFEVTGGVAKKGAANMWNAKHQPATLCLCSWPRRTFCVGVQWEAAGPCHLTLPPDAYLQAL